MLRQLTYLAHQMTARDQTIFLIEQIQPTWLPTTQRQRRYSWTIGAAFGLGYGLFAGLNFGLGVALMSDFDWLLSFPIGLSLGLFVGLLIGLLSGVSKIRPLEVLSWSWQRILFPGNVYTSRVLVMIIASIMGVFVLVSQYIVNVLAGLLVAVMYVLFVVLSSVLVTGLHIGSMEIKTVPNQGIKNSLQNGTRIMLFFGLAVLFVGLPLVLLTRGLVYTLAILFMMSPTIGIWGLAGWLPGVQHYALRFWLHRYHYLPLNLVPFLDLAAERLILQKVGGGYRFVHRLLQDYLASLYVEQGEG